MEGRSILWLGSVAALALTIFMLRDHLAGHVRVLLLLSQELPQVPLKPLHTLTGPPTYERVRFDSPKGTIVGDLFVPNRQGPVQSTRSALIVAHGIPLRENDRPVLLSFADTLARLGYIVLWPRGEPLDRGEPGLEDPATFVASIRYLDAAQLASPGHISFFGISVGSSLALVAAADAQVANRVRTIVSFGGYYDAATYLTELASRSMLENGQDTSWDPSEDALRQANAVLAGLRGPPIPEVPISREAAAAGLRASPRVVEGLERVSPSTHIRGLRARVFVLHDHGDPYVPYVESERLAQALPERQLGGVLFSNLFQHARVRGNLNWETAVEILRLYGFAHAALNSF